MLSVLTLELAEPLRIVVENKLNAISTYVFLEQETWFECEIPFLRRFLKPAMRVIDIGTNCGFYTLLAAHHVGHLGHVWGFEPGLTPMRLLKESLRVNGFKNVTLYSAAVSNEPGTVWFSDNPITELSMVVKEGTPGAREVKVESLDNLHQSGEITSIDFIKIDAEGHEKQVISGAITFFKFESPLVMLEVISDASGMNTWGPAQMLVDQGYELYRYCRGTGCLVPLVMGKLGDHILNIFLCKPDRALSLKEAGLLVMSSDLIAHYEPANPETFLSYFEQLIAVRSSSQLQELSKNISVADDATYYGMVAEYILSQDQTLAAQERYVRLCRAEAWIDNTFRDNIPLAKALTIARIWSACGRTPLICGLLGAISDGTAEMELTVKQLFLPASEEWETIPINDNNLFAWLANMVAQELERFRSFSSLYTPHGVRDAYNLALRDGYVTEALERRAALVSLVRGYQQFPDPIFIGCSMWRNKLIWDEIAQRLACGEKEIISLSAGALISA